jgi:DNA-binding NarL/FixJ family response regulator
MTGVLRVGIVEDNTQLRSDFTALIAGAEDMTCVGTFPSAEDAIAGLPGCGAQVVLMDIGLPGMTGIECVKRLRAARFEAQIVMLTSFDEPAMVFESLKAGATGYVLKQSPGAEILGAVRDVVAGGAPMSGAIARKVVQFFAQRGPAPEVETLSKREHDVLVALSQGQQYKEIAETLGISLNTVRQYVKAIYVKLHVNTRLDAVQKLGA